MSCYHNPTHSLTHRLHIQTLHVWGLLYNHPGVTLAYTNRFDHSCPKRSRLMSHDPRAVAIVQLSDTIVREWQWPSIYNKGYLKVIDKCQLLSKPNNNCVYEIHIDHQLPSEPSNTCICETHIDLVAKACLLYNWPWSNKATSLYLAEICNNLHNCLLFIPKLWDPGNSYVGL